MNAFSLLRAPFRRPALQVALGAALAAASLAAQAGTLTVNGWLFGGSGNNVNVVASPSYSGKAGGFTATLSGLLDPRFNFAPVELYCVDLGQYINVPGGPYSVKIDGETDSTTFTIMSAASVFDATIANRLGQLVSYAESVPTLVDTGAESTAMQLAIWNILDESDNALDAGTFREASLSTFGTDANSLLSASMGFGLTKELFVLKSATMQDQLFWIDAQRVPEPASLALAGLALAGLAATRRRRA